MFAGRKKLAVKNKITFDKNYVCFAPFKKSAFCQYSPNYDKVIFIKRLALPRLIFCDIWVIMKQL